MKRQLAAAMLAVVLALVAAGCTGGGGGEEGGGGIKEGGTLRIGTSSGIDSLNPFVGFNQDDYSTWMYIYPSLLQYDTRTYDFAAHFADRWEQSDDGLTVTFHTMPGATWSDGEPLTAEDAVWTIDTILKYADGPTGAWAASVAFLDSVEATDENTIVARYEQPAATALSGLGLIPILPPQVWEQYATGDGKGLKTFPNEPEGGQPLVSGGPFILTEYRKHDIALFEKNSSFYGPKPHIDGFGLQFFDNEDAMITALKTDQLDAINEIPPTTVETLKAAGMVVFQGPALALRDFIINSNPNKSEHRELLDPSVREAFEYAIDRDAIVETAWLGFATPGDALIPEGDISGGIDWHYPDIQRLPFDIPKANEILDSLGFQRGDDGIRIAGDHPMIYDVIFPHDESGAGDRAFQIIQNGFKQIGVRLVLKKMDDSAAFDAIGAPDWKYLDFDLAMWDWFPALDPDFLLATLTCAQYGSWSDTGYCDPEYEKLYKQQQVAVDQAERQKIVFQIQQKLYEDRPYIILSYDMRLDAWSPDWKGFLESNQGFFNAFSIQSLVSVHQT
jgi:peptide/nickel transport system substrate-binding protein